MTRVIAPIYVTYPLPGVCPHSPSPPEDGDSGRRAAYWLTGDGRLMREWSNGWGLEHVDGWVEFEVAAEYATESGPASLHYRAQFAGGWLQAIERFEVIE